MSSVPYETCQGNNIFGSDRIAKFKDKTYRSTNNRNIFLFCMQHTRSIQVPLCFPHLLQDYEFSIKFVLIKNFIQ